MVSKPKTPEDKGAHSCHHCGSPKHWDNDCIHLGRGVRKASVKFINHSPEYEATQEAYEQLHYMSNMDLDYLDGNKEELIEDKEGTLTASSAKVSSQLGKGECPQDLVEQPLHISLHVQEKEGTLSMGGITETQKRGIR